MQSIWQLINLFLFWLFFGFLTAYLAKRRGKKPTPWFFVGLFLGLFGVALVLILPWIEKKLKPRPIVVSRIQTREQVLALPESAQSWYFLDRKHTQMGPLQFKEFVEKWKSGEVRPDSYVWTDGMGEWKRVNALPSLQKALTSSP